MAELVLGDSLIDEYIKYKFNDGFNSNIIRKLFKYMQPFFLKDNHALMSDPSIPMQLSSDPLIDIINIYDDVELVQKSSLKLMLVDRFLVTSYTTININGQNEKLGLRFGGIYPNSMDKNKAQKHICALLSDGDWIKISDSYIDGNNEQWEKNKEILNDIVPHKTMDVSIESGSRRGNQSSLTGSKKSELQHLCADWNIRASQYNDNIKHDRYIETNKVKILLSSGLYNLASTSDKDFTYVIEIK